MTGENNSRGFMVLLSMLISLCVFSNVFAAGDIPYENLWKRISMDFKDADLKDVLKIFSQQSGLNFVAASDVEDKTLTLYLDNITVREALDKLLSANNLAYELSPQSNVFVVKPLALPDKIKTVTKVFYLKFARVPGSRLSKEIESGLKKEAELTGGESQQSKSTAEEGGILLTLKNVITEYGKIDIDPRTNSLIITDIPQQFSVIEEVIAKLDKSLPQLMIEVEILDVAKTKIDELGVKWPQAIAKLDITGSRITSFPFTTSRYHADISGAAWSELTSPGGTDLSGWDATKFAPTIFKIINAELALNFLLNDKHTKFLARPRILTTSNETAEIKIVSDEVIGLKREYTTEEGTTNVTEEAERAETGIALRVTPQVNLDNNEITMFLTPIVAESKDSSVESAIGQKYKDVEKRITKSIVRMKDSETLIIGGLIRKKDEEARFKVPFLSSIPILGAMFRSKSKTAEDRELVLFLTPHILRDDGWGYVNPAGSRGLAMGLDREQSLSGRDMEIERLLMQYE